MPVEIYKDILTKVVAVVCRQVGFEKASFEAVDILVEVLDNHLRSLCGLIAASGEDDDYFGLVDGVAALETMQQPLSSLIAFLDEVGHLMPKPIAVKCVPLNGRIKLSLPPMDQCVLASPTPVTLTMEHQQGGAIQPKEVKLCQNAGNLATTGSTTFRNPCPRSVPPWASRVTYRIVRVSYDPITKKLTEHEPPTPIVLPPLLPSDAPLATSRRSSRQSTSIFKRSTPAAKSPGYLPTSFSPKVHRSAEDAWNAALRAKLSPALSDKVPGRVGSPVGAVCASPVRSIKAPDESIVARSPKPVSAARSRSNTARRRLAFNGRKRRASFARHRLPAAKRFTPVSTCSDRTAAISKVATTPVDPPPSVSPVPVRAVALASPVSSSPGMYNDSLGGFSMASSHEDDVLANPELSQLSPKITPLASIPPAVSPCHVGSTYSSPDPGDATLIGETTPIPPNVVVAQVSEFPESAHSPSVSAQHTSPRASSRPCPSPVSPSSPPEMLYSSIDAVARSSRKAPAPMKHEASRPESPKITKCWPNSGSLSPDYSSTDYPSPAAVSDSGTDPMTDAIRAMDFIMPLPPLLLPVQRSPPVFSERQEIFPVAKSLCTSPSSSSINAPPVVLHFSPTARVRTSSLSSLNSSSSSSSATSSTVSSLHQISKAPPPLSSLSSLSPTKKEAVGGRFLPSAPITHSPIAQQALPRLPLEEDRTPPMKRSASPSPIHEPSLSLEVSHWSPSLSRETPSVGCSSSVVTAGGGNGPPLRLKIRIGADSMSCHSSEGPATETVSHLSPFSSTASSSSSSPSSDDGHSRNSSSDRRHAAIPPNLQVMRASPGHHSEGGLSTQTSNSGGTSSVAKAPKLVIRFGYSESNTSVVQHHGESAVPPTVPSLHLSIPKRPGTTLFSHERDALRGSSISSLSHSSSSSVIGSSDQEEGATLDSDGVGQLRTDARGPPVLPPPPCLDPLPLTKRILVPPPPPPPPPPQPPVLSPPPQLAPPPELEAYRGTDTIFSNRRIGSCSSEAMPAAPSLTPLLTSRSHGADATDLVTKSRPWKSKHKKSSTRRVLTTDSSSTTRRCVPPLSLAPPPDLDVLPNRLPPLPASRLPTTGRRACVDSIFTDDDDEEEEEDDDADEDLPSPLLPPSGSLPTVPANSRTKRRQSSKPVTLAPISVRPEVNPTTTQVMASSAGTSYYFNNNGEQIWLCPVCLSEDDGNLMVGCDSCDDWYHSGCLGLVKEPDAVQWFCPKCSGEPLPLPGAPVAKSASNLSGPAMRPPPLLPSDASGRSSALLPSSSSASSTGSGIRKRSSKGAALASGNSTKKRSGEQ